MTNEQNYKIRDFLNRVEAGAKNSQFIEDLRLECELLVAVARNALDCEFYYGGDSHSGIIKQLRKNLLALVNEK